MGNRATTTLERWGLNPRILSIKGSKRKDPPVPSPSPHQAPDHYVSDSVSPEPVYAVVNKKKKTDSDGMHYVEIQVLQSEGTSKHRRAAPQNSGSEYATIDFQRSATPNESSKPADILIPPGDLQGLMVKSQKRRSASSQRAVLV